MVKGSEGLTNRVSNIIRRYIDDMKLAALFIAFFHVLLVPFFLSLCIQLYVLYTFV